MEGIIFYWFAWIGWVLCTFFMKKDKKRTIICFTILVLVSCSIYQVTFFQIKVNIAYLCLLLTCYMYISQQRKRMVLYLLLVCLIQTIAFVSFQLFELFDPVWLVFNRKLMLAVMVVYLTLMLVKEPLLRIVCACVGLAQGELLYSLILYKFQFPVELGSLPFFDSFAITVMILTTWNFIEYLSSMLEAIVQRKTGRKAGINQ